MRTKMRQIAAAVIAAVLCTGAAWAAPESRGDYDPYGDVKFRVGLAYDGNSTGSLVAANLLNVAGYGSGYRFGYYDGELNFVELGYTSTNAISMVKTRNLYLSGQNYYETAPSGSYQVLGCYHLQLPGSYGDFESAQAAADSTPGGFVAWINGVYYVRANSYTTSENAEAAAPGYGGGCSVVWTSSYSVNVVVTGSTDILFQFDGGSSIPLGVMPGMDDSVETITWFKGYKYYGGFRYERLDGGNITVVNIVPINQYVKGVVPYESVKTWPLEALKAQAVCARNYALCDLNKHRAYNFDVCNTTDCQVYYGAGSGSIYPSALTDQAVDETEGIYAWYDGKLAATFFYSSNGGASEDVKNVWGSGSYPYLAGVEDPYEADVADKANNYYWGGSFTKSELTSILRSLGYCSGTTVENFEVSKVSPTGNALEIKFTYANGKSNAFSTVSTSTYTLRSRLGLAGHSIHFTISGGEQTPPSALTVNNSGILDQLDGLFVLSGDGVMTQLGGGDVPCTISGRGDVEAIDPQTPVTPRDTFVISGTGWGHSIGYSQWGGCAMANRGFTYDEILQFYFTGITVGPEG